jgi:hypothetical protein
MQYLANKISLDELEDWSAEAAIDIHNNPDGMARDLVFAIRGLLNEHEDDETPNPLKEALLEAVLVVLGDTSSSQTAELRLERATEELRAAA